MNFRMVKIKWARKLLKAKMFVIMTEKESAIAVDGADPYSFTDAVALAAQSAELEMFHESLGKLIADHKDALNKLGGVSNEPTTQKAPAASRETNAKPTPKGGKRVGQQKATVPRQHKKVAVTKK